MSNDSTPNNGLLSLSMLAPMLGGMNPSEDDLKKLLESLPPNVVDRLRSVVAPAQVSETKQPDLPPPPPPPFPEEPKVEEPKVVLPEEPKIVLPEFALRPPPTFKPLEPDYPLYDPDRCGSRALLGVLLTSIELPKQTSAGRALVLRTLQPTLVVDHAGRVFESKVGQDVLLEVSHWLRSLVRRAHNQDNVGEVWLKPGQRRPCDGGDFIYDWEIHYGRLFPRAEFMKSS